MILVTGASGQVGAALVLRLRSTGHDVLASDITATADADAVQCDLRSDNDIVQLFEQHRFSVVVHLAAVLPTAFQSDPLNGGDVNLSGSIRLLRAASKFRVPRFLFGSSASVYGSSARQLCTEKADPSPDEPYGASKLAIEKILEQLGAADVMEIVSLRIARVLGPGAKNTSSPWRSQIFERPSPISNYLSIPFAPQARLSVIHVHDLARVLQNLVQAPKLMSRIYNTPVELVRADEIKRLAEELRGWRVSLGTSHGGPEIDGTRFQEEFGFVTRSVGEHLSSPFA